MAAVAQKPAGQRDDGTRQWQHRAVLQHVWLRVARSVIHRLQAAARRVARLNYPAGPVGGGLVTDNIVEVVSAAAFARDDQNAVGGPAAIHLEQVSAGAGVRDRELR